MSDDGKRMPAPCGHPGVAVFNQYVRCLVPGCDGREDDGVPVYVDPEQTQRLCPHCGSVDVEGWQGMMTNGQDLWICHACGKSFTS